jgi:hypothetical protein
MMLVFEGTIMDELIHADTGKRMVDKAQGMRSKVRLF